MDAWYAFHKVGRLRYLTKYTGTESQREFPYGGTGIASIFTSIITYHRTSLCYISISCVGSPIAVRCQGKPSQRFTNVNVNNLCQSDTTLPKVFGSQLMHVLPPQATIIFTDVKILGWNKQLVPPSSSSIPDFYRYSHLANDLIWIIFRAWHPAVTNE